jgi:hypothetical protein
VRDGKRATPEHLRQLHAAARVQGDVLMTRLLPLILIACLVAGCAAKTRINQESGRDVRLDLPDGTSIEVKSTSQSKGSLTVPKGTNGGSGLDISEKGNSASLAGWFAPLRMEVGDRWGWMLMAGGIAGLFAAAFLFGTKFRQTAFWVGLAGGAMLILALASQATINAVLIGTVLLAVAFGAWRFIKGEKKKRIEGARKSAVVLKERGDRRAAVAVLREAKAPEWELENTKADVAEVKAAVAPADPYQK